MMTISKICLADLPKDKNWVANWYDLIATKIIHMRTDKINSSILIQNNNTGEIKYIYMPPVIAIRPASKHVYWLSVKQSGPTDWRADGHAGMRRLGGMQHR